MDDPLPRQIVWQLLLQLLLILVNAFFACTEIAVISINDNKLRKDAEQGDKKAQRLLALTRQPAKFLATIQVGITLAGFLGSAFAASNFSQPLADWLAGFVPIQRATLQTLSVVLITILLSYVTLVLGELVPKRIAMQKKEQIALAVSGVVSFLARVLAPAVWLLTASTNGLLRLLRLNTQDASDNVTEEEIRLMVDLGEEIGTIEPSEGEMIDNVLELGDKTAVELMTHRTDVTVLWMEDDEAEWQRVICETTHSRYPVCAEDIDSVVGVLHVRDFFCNARDAHPKPVREILREAYFVPETAQADALLRDMRREKMHIAIVVDEYGGTSGVITMEDLLEEIVGQIEDEHDLEEQQLIPMEDGRWLVQGAMPIDKVGEALDVEFPEGDYDTLGGMIYAQMNAIPQDGSNPEVDVAGLHIRVTELVDHRVEWAEVTPLPKPPEEPDTGKEKDKSRERQKEKE